MDYKEFEEKAQKIFKQQVKLFIYDIGPIKNYKFIICQEVDGSFEFVSSPAYKDDAELAYVKILIDGMNKFSILQEEAVNDNLIQLLRKFSQQTTEQMIGNNKEQFKEILL